MVFISATTRTSSTAETLLGIIIDSELNLENHLNSICNKMSRKFNSLDSIINNCMPLGKYKILMKIFIESQFSVLSYGCLTQKKSLKNCLFWPILTVYSDYNFIPEILRQLDLQLKPYHIWHLKFDAGFLKPSRLSSSLETRTCLLPLCKIFATG